MLHFNLTARDRFYPSDSAIVVPSGTELDQAVNQLFLNINQISTKLCDHVELDDTRLNEVQVSVAPLSVKVHTETNPIYYEFIYAYVAFIPRNIINSTRMYRVWEKATRDTGKLSDLIKNLPYEVESCLSIPFTITPVEISPEQLRLTTKAYGNEITFIIHEK